MRLLLDTHTFLWFVWDDPQLSAAARAFIEAPANRCMVSLASCWEIAIKAGKRKLVLGAAAKVFINREVARNGLEFLEISLPHATAIETLPQHHNDPFDRLLIAQALIENIPVVSVDKAFDPYGLSRLW